MKNKQKHIVAILIAELAFYFFFVGLQSWLTSVSLNSSGLLEDKHHSAVCVLPTDDEECLIPFESDIIHNDPDVSFDRDEGKINK